MEKDAHDDFELTTEELELINSVIKPTQMSLEEALQSDDPLGNINNNLSGKTKAEKAFRLLYAAFLEVNSAGVSILFDRFSKREMKEIYQKYSDLNVHKLCSAIDTIHTLVCKQLGDNPSRSKVQQYLNLSPNEIRCIDTDTGIVNEMEQSLLAYAKKFLMK